MDFQPKPLTVFLLAVNNYRNKLQPQTNWDTQILDLFFIIKIHDNNPRLKWFLEKK